MISDDNFSMDEENTSCNEIFSDIEETDIFFENDLLDKNKHNDIDDLNEDLNESKEFVECK